MGAPRHILVALVEDKPGVLNRIASLFRRRGFNIASLAVGHSEIPHLSRMTIVVEGDGTVREQAARQLDKLVDVIKVLDITDEPIVTRELALLKVKAVPPQRSEIIEIVDIFRGNIIDVSSDTLIIEVTGDEEKIDSLYNLFKPFGVREIMRTGQVAMVRGISTMDTQGGSKRPKKSAPE